MANQFAAQECKRAEIGVVVGMGVVGINVLEDAVQTVQKDYRTISISLSPGL